MRRDFSAELYSLFRAEIVLDMMTIKQSFPSRTRMSIFRDMQKIGAISSCNNRGQNYTLKEIAVFDQYGLWEFNGAVFSECGNLKNTIAKMISKSDAGMTHSELQSILGWNVHDTLLELVENQAVYRKRAAGAYVYFDAVIENQAKQLEKRTASKAQKAIRNQTDLRMVVEVLSYVIRHPQATTGDTYERFQSMGISYEEVGSIYDQYVNGKKN